MWIECKQSADEAGVKAAAYSTICILWRVDPADNGNEANILTCAGMAIMRAANTYGYFINMQVFTKGLKVSMPYRLITC